MHYNVDQIFRKRILLYRAIKNRRGFGVHSPFVFNLITKVIEERCPFYAFNDIDLLRKKMHYQQAEFDYKDAANKPCRDTIARIVDRQAIPAKQGKLLFRLANYFKAKKILQVGSGVGLSSLYLSAYAKDLTCIVLEEDSRQAAIARYTYGQLAFSPIDLRTGNYAETFPKALQEMESPDMIFFNNLPVAEPESVRKMMDEAVSCVGDKTLFVVPGIQSSPAMRNFWQSISRYPEVTVTLDLYSIGLVIFNPKLHKRDYTVFF